MSAPVLPPILELDNTIREYAWGSVDAIPALLGIEPSGRPAAELWIGAHPDEPSRWAGHPDRPGLDELVAADPQWLLGPAAVSAFGPRLPFLLKVLAADKALSMQVHPTLGQAQAGFRAEEAAGVPRDSAERNYSDPNHKPELAYALTDFEAFCGFRPEQQTAELFDAVGVPELKPYASLLTGSEGLRATFTTLLTLGGQTRQRLIEACLDGCRRLADDGGEWAGPARAAVLAGQDFPDDIGSVLSLMLNYVRLAPGEAIFLGAGNVHAYLRGTCVEVLANSDNVLRCGLTPKHVDVPELLRVADFTALAEPRWPASELGGGHRRFAGPVADFALSVYELSDAPVTLEAGLPHLILAGGGGAEVAVGGTRHSLGRWQAVFVAAGESGNCLLSGSGPAFVVATNL